MCDLFGFIRYDAVAGVHKQGHRTHRMRLASVSFLLNHTLHIRLY